MDDKYKYQKKYDHSHGVVSKSYKLKRETVDLFKSKCDEDGRSQASVLQELMIRYINGED